MRIIDKYQLAKEPNGTPYYELDEDGNIASGLQILDAFRSKDKDGEIFFNGVTYTYPDNDLNNGCQESFTDNIPEKFELYNVDTDSNDYEDDDRFLVLSEEDFKELLDTLENYYQQMVDNPVPEIEFDETKPLFGLELTKTPLEILQDDLSDMGIDNEAANEMLDHLCEAFRIPKDLLRFKDKKEND